jgi:hypothetical protein
MQLQLLIDRMIDQAMERDPAGSYTILLGAVPATETDWTKGRKEYRWCPVAQSRMIPNYEASYPLGCSSRSTCAESEVGAGIWWRRGLAAAGCPPSGGRTSRVQKSFLISECFHDSCQRKWGLDMGHRRQLVVGLILLAGGLVVVAIGATYAFADPVVALGYFVVVPSLVSCCGIVFIVVGLARSTRSTLVYRIVGVSAMCGLGLALGFGAAGILSQVPDSLAGLNGAYIPGSAPGIGVFVLGGIGLSVGLVIGAVASLVWWAYRGRHLPPRSVESPKLGSRT